ncbi:VWA domain-containing protein [Chondromyces crocatus]|uniref:VWFA domain-containing protein n=1 Tax=Chondromyces crocatus TaxID=52 RepID=A0A0K1EIE5_CHOCO|nr:VWA domain-containing protein [Chondromyces crocatus]AKT40631.1 uncharacterized protein CMC5_047870 [Chondromyces crocatus]
MLRSSLPLLCVASLFALASTGCAVRGRATARVVAPVPVISVHGQGTGGVGVWGHAHGGGTYDAPPPAPAPVGVPWRPPPVFYGIPLEGAQDVVFVLDQSGSMESATTSPPVTNPVAGLALLGARAMNLATNPAPGGFLGLGPSLFQVEDSKLEAAKAELISTISMLPDGTRYNLVFFHDHASQLAPQLVTMNPISRLSTISFIQNLRPENATAAVPALRTAYSMRPRRVVFLSDGLANVGGDRHTLLVEARLAMRQGVRFDTVGVGPDQDGELMQALARESGGVSSSR